MNSTNHSTAEGQTASLSHNCGHDYNQFIIISTNGKAHSKLAYYLIRKHHSVAENIVALANDCPHNNQPSFEYYKTQTFSSINSTEILPEGKS